MSEKKCSSCVYQSRLVMWERNGDGVYLPNYHKELTCCTVLVRLSDGSNTVYGHTEPHDGVCEMFTERGEVEE